MKILIAEDDASLRKLLEMRLSSWGFEVTAVEDGRAAWEALQAEDPPRLALLDWLMPELEGVEVCRRVRARETVRPPYIILLTVRDRAVDVVEGLRAGANDFISKPFDSEELRARMQVGQRIVELQEHLARRVRELEDALSRVKQLQGLLPICSFCKKIRDDRNYWRQVEEYLDAHSEATFSHGICPECYALHMTPQLDELRRRKEEEGKESPGRKR